MLQSVLWVVLYWKCHIFLNWLTKCVQLCIFICLFYFWNASVVCESFISVLADIFLSFYVICLFFSDSPLPVSSRVCFVKFHDPDSAVVAQHLTNTVFVDRALIVVPYAEGLCFV